MPTILRNLNILTPLMCSVYLTVPGSNSKETESFRLLWQFYTEVEDPELLEAKTEKDSIKENTVPFCFSK